MWQWHSDAAGAGPGAAAGSTLAHRKAASKEQSKQDMAHQKAIVWAFTQGGKQCTLLFTRGKHTAVWGDRQPCLGAQPGDAHTQNSTH